MELGAQQKPHAHTLPCKHLLVNILGEMRGREHVIAVDIALRSLYYVASMMANQR
jgi:hypothetical protein